MFFNLESYEVAASTKRGEQLLTEPIAICRYYLGEKSIYISEDGEYYYHPHPRNDMEFFSFGQLELTSELIPLNELDIEPVKELHTLSEKFMEMCGVAVVTQLDIEDSKPDIVIYLDDVGCFIYLSTSQQDILSGRCIESFKQLNPATNTLATPYRLLLNENEDVMGIEVIELC